QPPVVIKTEHLLGYLLVIIERTGAMISYLNRTAGRRALAMPTLRRAAHTRSCDELVSEEDTMIAMRKMLCWLAAVMCLLGGAWAQVQTSELHVLVKDAKGAVVSGATITAAEAGKGISRTATTNAEGIAILLSLPPGPYSVAVEAPGFAKMVNESVRL